MRVDPSDDAIVLGADPEGILTACAVGIADMCVGDAVEPSPAEGDDDDDFERFYNALDLTAYFAGPYELQDVDDDAADNTEPVQATVLETVGGAAGERVGAVFMEVVEVFGYMHSCMIMYRDLKPENLLVDDEGHVRPIDLAPTLTLTLTLSLPLTRCA